MLIIISWNSKKTKEVVRFQVVACRSKFSEDKQFNLTNPSFFGFYCFQCTSTSLDHFVLAMPDTSSQQTSAPLFHFVYEVKYVSKLVQRIIKKMNEC